MRRTHKAAAVVALAATTLFGSGQIANASGTCLPVVAQIVDAGTTEDCNSPNDFCAAGTVHGTINGTTYYTMDGGVRGPANAPGYIMATGILVYTTRIGTLTVRETGVTDAPADASSGTLSAVEDIQGGTGFYAGWTGHLFVNGNASGGRFTSSVTGQVCR